jgi:putative endonuclease
MVVATTENVILSEAKDLSRAESMRGWNGRALACVMRQLYIYVLASRSRVLYVGVTNDLRRRLREHRSSKIGFTAAYHVNRLVYYEVTANASAAISREKELKGWSRKRKLALIEGANPRWTDLAERWCDSYGLS